MISYKLKPINIGKGIMKWSFSVNGNESTLDDDFKKAIKKNLGFVSDERAEEIAEECGYKFD